MFVLYFEI